MLLTELTVVIICSIAVAYSMGQIIKSVCVCPSVHTLRCNASGHNYWNSSFIMDVAMRQIPRSTERISSYLSKRRHNWLFLVAIICEIARLTSNKHGSSRPVFLFTGVKNVNREHGPWTRVKFYTPVFTDRECCCCCCERASDMPKGWRLKV